MKFNILKRKQAKREVAPQYTRWERQALSVPGPAAGALPYETYSAMESDSMIQTALTLKRLGAVAPKWRVTASSDSPSSRARQAFVEEAFARMEGSPLTILYGAMDAFSKGWSIQEMVFVESGGRLWLSAVRPKDPAMFGLTVDRFGTLQSLELQVPGEPVQQLNPAKFVVYENRSGYGRPKGRSDLDAAYPHYAAKVSLLAAWQSHLQRFSTPTMLASFDAGATEEERAALLSGLNSLSTVKAMVFPDDFKVTSIPSDTQASQGFMDAIDFHNREIARAILGQTLTTDEGRRVGSLALGRVHLQVLLLQLEAIRKELADRVMTEQVIRPLVELNFGPGDIPRFEFEAVTVDAFQTGKLA